MELASAAAPAAPVLPATTIDGTAATWAASTNRLVHGAMGAPRSARQTKSTQA